MHYLFKERDIAVRRMEDSAEDYKLLTKWLSNPEVLAYYEGLNNPFDYEKVIQKFSARVKGMENVVPCILECDKLAIGYLQFYRIVADEYNVSEIIDMEDYRLPYGIDIFIGETNYWNMGIGTKLLQAVIQYLFDFEKADAIFIDPQTWNRRAIRCYEKCGFKPIGMIEKRELQDGEYKDSLIMAITVTGKEVHTKIK
jgi:aminoglycoside 6'-N-acetyltransferase